MSKITLSTVKSFIKKNRNDLMIKVKTKFDGMTDGCEPQKNEWVEATQTTEFMEHTLGVEGAWFTTSSRNFFTPYESTVKDNWDMEGYEISNCCGSFVLAIIKY